MFALTAERFGLRQAIYLDSKLRESIPPPSQGLRARKNESGKSYTKRSAKTKRLSGSLASLKKRSSTRAAITAVFSSTLKVFISFLHSQGIWRFGTRGLSAPLQMAAGERISKNAGCF